MKGFYAEAGYEVNEELASRAFEAIITDKRLGFVWIIEAEGQPVGHLVIVLRYAMEYGGFIACLDDLYVDAAWRNRGLSTSALTEVTAFCRNAGIRAMTVEVGRSNAPAQAVYRRAGFQESDDRQLLAFELAPPVHVL